MRWFRLRPTFEIAVVGDRNDVIDKIAQRYQAMMPAPLMFVAGEYGELHLPVAEHRVWSPHLSFYIQDREGLTFVQGRFAPRLEVWTFVWVIYLAMAFSAFFGLALGYSQWSLGGSAWGGWVAIGAGLVIATLYVVAHLGQQWSDDQMRLLREQLDEFLRLAEVEILPAATGESAVQPIGIVTDK